jgi:hypothetical protein
LNWAWNTQLTYGVRRRGALLEEKTYAKRGARLVDAREASLMMRVLANNPDDVNGRLAGDSGTVR